MTDLDELERLAKAATPGPWTVVRGHKTKKARSVNPILRFDSLMQTERPEENAAYIAACSPDTVLRLVRAARALETIAGGWTNNFPGAQRCAQAAVAQLREGE